MVCDVLSLQRVLGTSDADKAQSLIAFVKRPAESFSLATIPWAEVLHLAGAHDSTLNVRVSQQICKVAEALQAAEDAACNVSEVPGQAIACHAHLLRSIASKAADDVAPARKQAKSRSKASKAAVGGCLGAGKALEAFCNGFKALWPHAEVHLAPSNANEPSDADELLCLCAQALVAAASAVHASASGVTAAEEVALPVMQACFALDESGNWQHIAAEVLLDSLASASLDAWLLQALTASAMRGDRNAQAAAIAIHLRSRIDSQQHHGTSSAKHKDAAQATQLLLRLASSTPEVSLSLTLLPMLQLAEAMRPQQPTTRKLAMLCCQQRLLHIAGCSPTRDPAGTTDDGSSHRPSAKAPALHLTSGTAIPTARGRAAGASRHASPHPLSTAQERVNAVSAQAALGERAQATELHIGLAEWLAAGLMHAIAQDADATARKHACALAAHAAAELMQLSSAQRVAWCGNVAAALACAVAQAVHDASSKIVRQEAAKALAKLCEGVACADAIAVNNVASKVGVPMRRLPPALLVIYSTLYMSAQQS